LQACEIWEQQANKQQEQNGTMDGLFTGPQAYCYYFRRWALSDGCCRLPIEPLDGQGTALGGLLVQY